MTDPRAEQAIAYIQEQVARLEKELAELRASANSIAKRAGLPTPYPAGGRSDRAATPTIGELAVAKTPSPGQFAACRDLPAALLAYFEWRGRELGAVSIEDLRDALVLGSFAGMNKDASALVALRDVLVGDRRFGRLKNGYFGLAGWVKERGKAPTAG